MKRRRLFVAIDISEQLRAVLGEFQDAWKRNFPARWVDPQNMHTTVRFIGPVPGDNIPDVADAVRGAARECKPFVLTFTAISYGPDINRPRIIWAQAEENPEFVKLCRSVDGAIKRLPFRVQGSTRELKLHVTLARFNSFDLKQYEGDGLPRITESIKESFTVNRLQLVESKLRRGGPKYSVLKSVRIGE